MSKYLTPRDGDKDLDAPPLGVVISIMGLIGGHWSDCIVTDNRPLHQAVQSPDREAEEEMEEIQHHDPVRK